MTKTPAQRSPIYLDHAAATPVSDAVLVAMQPFWQQQFHNPSATYLSGREVAQAVSGARRAIAGVLGARPHEIIFTAGGTEANNLAIHGSMQSALKANSQANLVVSAIEHDSVLMPAGQYECRLAAVKPDGIVDLAELEKQIDDDTVLVSVMYANNEIGSIQPLQKIAKMLQKIRLTRQKKGNATPLYLHTDACQAANLLDLHVSRLGVDLMTLNGGKIYGPKQSGLLYVRSGVTIQPQVLGGGQERGLRSGTENAPGIIGFATALQEAQDQRITEEGRLNELQSLFIQELREQIPVAVVNGTLSHRLANNVHITLPGTDNERIMMELDEQGIQCAVGSACSASNDEPSHVLKAIGLSDADAQASLRFTMGRDTKKRDIQQTVQSLANILPQ